MATKSKVEVEDDSVVGNGRSDVYRMSVTLDPSLRRHIRIAAAIADMTPGEWACAVLERAANKATIEDNG